MASNIANIAIIILTYTLMIVYASLMLNISSIDYKAYKKYENDSNKNKSINHRISDDVYSVLIRQLCYTTIIFSVCSMIYNS